MQDGSPIPRYMLLDGGTATNLFLAGMKPDDCLETWMLTHPDKQCAPCRGRAQPFLHAVSIKRAGLGNRDAGRVQHTFIGRAGACLPCGTLQRLGVDGMATALRTVPAHSPLSPEAFPALPVCFQSEDAEALSRALFLYNGRAMVDSNCTIEEGRLRKIADRYGAFVY